MLHTKVSRVEIGIEIPWEGDGVLLCGTAVHRTAALHNSFSGDIFLCAVLLCVSHSKLVTYLGQSGTLFSGWWHLIKSFCRN